MEKKFDQKLQESVSNKKMIDTQVAQLAEKVSQLANEKFLDNRLLIPRDPIR